MACRMPTHVEHDTLVRPCWLALILCFIPLAVVYSIHSFVTRPHNTHGLYDFGVRFNGDLHCIVCI